MGIEEIPEMQVREDNFSGARIVEPSALQGFQGKFVVIEGLNGKTYIFAQRYLGAHEEIAFYFKAVAHGDYKCKEGFSPIGGGRFKINEQEISFYDKSTYFGKYDEQVVRPIAERWKQQNLPNHELVFE